jgi:hypothetical protein
LSDSNVNGTGTVTPPELTGLAGVRRGVLHHHNTNTAQTKGNQQTNTNISNAGNHRLVLTLVC